MTGLCRTLVAFFATGAMLVPAAAALADATLAAGFHDLLPNTPNQKITLSVSGDLAVRGMNLRMQIGDGLEPQPEPQFTGVDFAVGIWQSLPITTLGGPVDGAEQFLQASVNLSESGPTVVTDGAVAQLTISTVGIFAGTYDLLLDSETIGEGTDFIMLGGDAVVPSLVAGQIHIVPEPATSCCLGLGLLAVSYSGSRLRRGRRQHARVASRPQENRGLAPSG